MASLESPVRANPPASPIGPGSRTSRGCRVPPIRRDGRVKERNAGLCAAYAVRLVRRFRLPRKYSQ